MVQENKHTKKKFNWLNALSVQERLPLCNTDIGFDQEQGEFRLNQWRENLATEALLAELIQSMELELDELIRLLGETLESLSKRRDLPDWAKNIENAYERYHSLTPIDLQDGIEGSFLTAIEPLLTEARQKLQKSCTDLNKQYRELEQAQRIESLFASNLVGRIMGMFERTMVLELHVARLREQLTGANSIERFQSFLNRLTDPNISLDILREYPVLIQQIQIQIEQWIANSTETYQHYCEDYENLKTTFALSEDDKLIAIEQGSGDRHRAGRSVTIFSFRSGKKLVYKPRSLTMDAHFQDLLEWINQTELVLPFKIIAIMNGDEHGWSEFAYQQACQHKVEVQNYYQRLGAYLAILYVLEASDFHYENLIAVGEHPILIDLESLFQPRLPISGFLSEAVDATFAAADAVNASVLRTGLLPSRMWGNEDTEGIDLSGVGGDGGQITPMKIPQWINQGSDDMRLTREQMQIDARQNRVILDGEGVSVLSYTDELIEGFSSVYHLLQQNKEVLLRYILPAFKQDHVRVILRDTAYYSRMLYESFHPDLLKNSLVREGYVNALWNATATRPHLKRFVEAEHRDILRGDVPIFTAKIDDYAVYDADAHKYENVLAETGYERVRNRLGLLSDDDLKRQIWFIKGALGVLVKHSHEATREVRGDTEPQKLATSDDYLVMAKRVGDYLLKTALRNQQGISWIGVVFGQSRQHTSLMPLGADLYSGLPGLALFLGYLGKITGEVAYSDVAEEIIDTLKRHSDSIIEMMTTPGAFGGLGGVIYTYTLLSNVLSRSDLLQEAVILAQHLPNLVQRDHHYDVINGSAGAVLALLNLYDVTNDEILLTIAEAFGQHIIDNHSIVNKRLGWIVPGMAGEPIAGMSHGSAGIAWTLLYLAEKTGNNRYHDIGERAIEDENNLYNETHQNWADLREFDGVQLEDVYLNFWCHGASGLGLARLRTLQTTYNERLRPIMETDLQKAIEAVRRDGFGYNHSLCHGDLGNLDLLISAQQAYPKLVTKEEITHIASLILEDMSDHWSCGTPTGVETPGFMMGLAGIGYEMLRLAEPKNVPSVLGLQGLIQ